MATIKEAINYMIEKSINENDNYYSFSIGDPVEFSADGRIVCNAVVYDVVDHVICMVTRYIEGVRGGPHFLEFYEHEDEEGVEVDFQQDAIYIVLEDKQAIRRYIVNVPSNKARQVGDVLDNQDKV